MVVFKKEALVNQEIPDRGGIANTIEVHQEGDIKALHVGVNIEHPFIGDLKVALIGPDGTTVVLHNRSGGNTNNIKTTFEGEVLAAFVGKSGQGEWTLEVKDYAPRDTGTLIGWDVTIDADEGAYSHTFIPEGEAALVSTQVCTQSGILENIQVHVNIEHPFIGDLGVKLVAPDGTKVTLHHRQGGSTDNLDTLYDMADIEGLYGLKGKNIEGTWSLVVRDYAPKDNGRLKKWNIALAYQQINDLTEISGISDEQVAVLNSHGIHSFNKLGCLGTAELRDMLAGTEGDLSYDGLNSILDEARAVQNEIE
jgi:subtilisin-like proprotein convertase family protein